VDLIFQGFALFCCLVSCEGQQGRGTPGESGMSQAISLCSAEKSWKDLVLLKANSLESWTWMLQTFGCEQHFDSLWCLELLYPSVFYCYLVLCDYFAILP